MKRHWCLTLLATLALQAKDTVQGAVDYTTEKASQVTQAVADATKKVEDTVASSVSGDST